MRIWLRGVHFFVMDFRASWAIMPPIRADWEGIRPLAGKTNFIIVVWIIFCWFSGEISLFFMLFSRVFR